MRNDTMKVLFEKDLLNLNIQTPNINKQQNIK